MRGAGTGVSIIFFGKMVTAHRHLQHNVLSNLFNTSKRDYRHFHNIIYLLVFYVATIAVIKNIIYKFLSVMALIASFLFYCLFGIVTNLDFFEYVYIQL